MMRVADTSLAEQMKALSPEQQQAALQAMADDINVDIQVLAKSLIHDWRFWARPAQLTPAGYWKWWFCCTGRRWGKTRTASEWVHERIEVMPRGIASTGILLHRTASDLRDIMIEGPSGLMATAKPGKPVTYEPSKTRVTFHNGYVCNLYSAEEPDQTRGATASLMWADEFSSLKATTGIDGMSAFDNARIALSAPVPGDRPRGIITTTPRRVKAVKDVFKDAALSPEDYVITTGTMRDNIANLDESTVRDLITRYAGTALGSQELDGVLAADVEGAGFKSGGFIDNRLLTVNDCPEFAKICVAVDPSVGDGSGDECGIVVCAVSHLIPTRIKHGDLHVVKNLAHFYVLEDASLSAPPDKWARVVDEVAAKWSTTSVVVEGNNGGEVLRSVLRSVNPALRVKIVHARFNKVARAEPVAALFAQGRGHIVGEMPELEDQCTTYTGDTKESPDRHDAMVWGGTYLLPEIGRMAQQVKFGAGHLGRQIG